MSDTTKKIAAERLLVVMPNWLGDGVMATPMLRALRGLYPQAYIAAVARPLVAPVLSGSPFVAEARIIKKGEERDTVAWMKKERFDLGLLLPNSFRSAWMLWRGGVRRRVGYAREGRSILLTDRIYPLKRVPSQVDLDAGKAKAIQEIAESLGKRDAGTIKVGSPYQPVPTVQYYLELARFLRGEAASYRGAQELRMELGITELEREEAGAMLKHTGRSEPMAVLVPGANFGSSKCWLPERFAAVADWLVETRGMRVIIASSPAEMPIVEAILSTSRAAKASHSRVMALAKMNDGKGASLGALKEIVRQSALMICNDTGPRHFAAAFGIPTVTLFGPTDPVWAETYHAREKIVRIDVPCSPCQLKKCPIDHRCMKGIEERLVMAAVDELFSPPPRLTVMESRGATS